MLFKTFTTGLKAIGSLPEYLRAARSTSLIDYTQPARVEPIVLVDSNAVFFKDISDVMQSVLMIFSGYYLQAASISVNVGKVNVVRMLEKLNPSRNPAENAALFIGDALLSEESYKHKFPNPKQLVRSLEAGYPLEEEDPARSLTLGKDTVKLAQSVTNLSVGTLLELNIESDGNKMTMPISVRLISHSIRQDNLIHILSYASKNQSVKERYYAWRAGSKDTIADMIFCQDLIDEHRKALLDDKSGIYKEILRRNTNNKISAVISGQPSISSASNIAIMTRDTAVNLQAEIGGSLDTFSVRERVFKNTYLMLIVVIDDRYDQVIIYHRGISIPTEVSIKDIKASNKSGGPDVSEILKAYQLGNAPTFR